MANLSELSDQEFVTNVGADEFAKCWQDAVEDPASSDKDLSDIATSEMSRIMNTKFSLTNWTGAYLFDAKIGDTIDSKNTVAQYSSVLRKLYIKQNKSVDLRLLYSVPESYAGHLSLSSCLLFSDPEHYDNHVEVCLQHAARADGTPRDALSKYILRLYSDSLDVKYVQFPSGRYVVKLENLPVIRKTNYQMTNIQLKFTDLSSCPGGINRRNTSLVLCLIDQTGQTVGRSVIPVRICASPKRDRLRDERETRAHLVTDQTVDMELSQGQAEQQYWVLATNKRNYELLRQHGELLEETVQGDVTKWREQVDLFNSKSNSQKRRKIDIPK